VTPQDGDELVNPKAGTRTVFLATAASTGGTHVQVEATYPPHSPLPPMHHHPDQQEHFQVVSGAMSVVRAGESFTSRAGEQFTVERDVSHQMWNDGDDPAVVVWTTTPAMRTDEMFCALWQVAHDNDWAPTAEQLWAVLEGYDAEFRLG
jgi:mannose-6-phosphate isomerase-like protein (cupin superfamily)